MKHYEGEGIGFRPSLFDLKLKRYSLSVRLLVSEGLVLAAFFALVAVVLEQGFRDSAEQALREKLQVHIYSLLAVAEMDEYGQLILPATLREPRFANPGSGLYAVVYDSNQRLVWRSSSALGMELTSIELLPPGKMLFRRDIQGLFQLDYAVIWQNQQGLEQAFLFSVAEDKTFLTHEVGRFRRTLRTWLAVIGIFLVGIQFLILRWSLKPLRVIGNDLAAIENGQKNSLEGDYGTELNVLAANLNALIRSGHSHLERYRHTLGDLAHSLKTPLAILNGALQTDKIDKNLVADQLIRMNEIVEYQLQKAAAQGRRELTGKIDLVMIMDKIISSLQKVYTEKNLTFDFNPESTCYVYASEGDVYEILGNLLDNAAKWCQQNIKITLQPSKDSNAVRLIIEDDGPGIPIDQIEKILHRGVRADQRVAGHGIGMAVVHELVSLLGGQLQGERSERLGGMKWILTLP